jgi:hypothetical protein
LEHKRIRRLPSLHVESSNHLGNFADSRIESLGKDPQASSPVQRAQRLPALIGTNRNEAIHIAREAQNLGAQTFQEIRPQSRHIASHHQVPLARGVKQRSFQPTQRTISRPSIGNDRETELPIFFRVADESNIPDNASNQSSGLLSEGNAIHLQQSLVPPHPRAVSARQYISGCPHAEMIALRNLPILRFSALVSLAVLFSAGAYAEDSTNRTTLVVKTDSRTGRLIRSVVVAAKVVNPDEPEPAEQVTAQLVTATSLAEMIDTIAAKHEIEAPLVHSVIKAESNYNPLALSPKGAQGLMQLIPATARRFGVENSFNAQQNIEGGVKYLKFLMELYHNDYVKVIAAYNAGEAAVTKYGGIPPYAETRNYVYQVGKNLQTARKVAEAKNAAPKPEEPKQIAAVGSDQPHKIEAVIGPDGKLYYKTQ